MATFTPNAWVSIGADDVITIQFGATEMGQGSMTSVPLVLAEEMDVDWERVRVETVSRHDPTYGNPVAFGYYGFPIMYTAGSAALRGYFNAMRQAGAQARRFLLDSAAMQLGVPVEELSTEPSRVVHAASGRSLSYGEVAATAQVPDSLPEVPESEFKPRSEHRQKDVEDALNLSRELGRPVKVIWSREDDVRDGIFRPLAAQYLGAALDADGQITALQQRVATPSVLSFMNEPRWGLSGNRDGISMNSAQVTRYAIPNIRAEHVMVDRCSRLAAWRGVATSYTRFANESFIDEIAHTVGADPLEFRLDLTRDNPAGRSVLEEVAQMAEWSRPREGTTLGVALSDYGGASVAAGIAEVSVNEATGAITVHRYWMAIDAGFIVSPRNTEAQMEGNIVYGISSALKERISVNAGSVDQSNFHDYPVMRMNEMPELHVRALPSDAPPSGVGELGLATTGPAIANAVFAATGVRLRELPMTPERVLAALRGA